MEESSHSLPSGAINKIRSIKGNDKCMDCGSTEPDWGDVLHGSLICIQCAGRHRALGVSVAFCRSLTMDNWTEANLLSMLLGGNRQLHSFFARQQIENSAIEALYTSRPAAYYREQLANQVEQLLEKRRTGRGVLSDEESKEEPSSPQSDDTVDIAENKKQNNLKKKTLSAPPIAALQRKKNKPTQTRVVDCDVEIDDVALGASLTRSLAPPGWQHTGSLALVTKVNTQGAASRAGIRVGDYVIAMNGRALADYDEFISIFPAAPRPARLTIRRYIFCGHSKSRPASPEPQDTIRIVNFGMDQSPLGMSIERCIRTQRARVSKVAPGGRAAKLGIKTDDVIVSLNGRDTSNYDIVIDTLPLLPKPLLIGLLPGGGSVALLQRKNSASAVMNTNKSAVAILTGRPTRALSEKAPAARSSGSYGAAYRPAPIDDDSSSYDEPRLGTKKILSSQLDDEKEYEVTFDTGPIGLRLEERLGLIPVSVVTLIQPGSQAEKAGISIGSTLQGINGEKYLSHAHTTATLRHGKRPILVRFRHSD
mmetsp:Transcript_1407/g.1835  ORF Transcript_1407/g.1835 Transcript_1407/m.1835 type:complete len:536 (-) Transcript_1407:235-1842(-)